MKSARASSAIRRSSRTWVNGALQLSATASPFRSIPPAVGIGLQVHGGAGFDGLVRYRNLRVRLL
jgi:hypothetical protein